MPGPRHQGRHQRGRAQPAGLAEALRELGERLGLDAAVAHVDGRRPPRPGRASCSARGHPTGAPRHRRAARGRRRHAGDGERLPRRLGHRRRARRPAPTWWCARGSPTPSLVVGPAAWWHGWAARRPGTRSPARSSPGTSSSAGRRRPAATTRSSTRSPTCATRASRSPRSRPTGRARSPSTPAPAGSSRSAPSPRSCSTRSPSRPTRTPTSSRTSTPSGSTQDGPGPGPDLGHARRRRRRPTLKVAINYLGGYRNTMTMVLTGLDIEAKAASRRGDAVRTSSAAASSSTRSTSGSSAPTARTRPRTRWPPRSCGSP